MPPQPQGAPALHSIPSRHDHATGCLHLWPAPARGGQPCHVSLLPGLRGDGLLPDRSRADRRPDRRLRGSGLPAATDLGLGVTTSPVGGCAAPGRTSRLRASGLPLRLFLRQRNSAGQTKEESVARKTIRVSDRSGEEIPEGKGATVRITFADARKGVRELDLTDSEAESLGGRAVARRGRRPKGMS